MEKTFSQDEIDGNVSQHINDLIIDKAGDLAEKFTEFECSANGIVCYNVEIQDGIENLIFTDEAQEIFNEYYDKYTEELYELLNNQLKVIE